MGAFLLEIGMTTNRASFTRVFHIDDLVKP